MHFSTHRSGSVPIGILLEYYMENALQTQGLGDVFEMRRDFQLPRDRRIKSSLKTIEQRWSWIKNQDQKYFFTVYPVVTNELMQELLKSHRFIFSERKNLVAQILSFLIVENKDQFYQDGGLGIRKSSILGSYRNFRKIEAQLFQYFRLKAELKPEKVLTYETFLKHTPRDFLETVGFSKPIDWSNLKLTEKQNPENKLELFTNPREIENWYRDSYLQKIYPWKKRAEKY